MKKKAGGERGGRRVGKGEKEKERKVNKERQKERQSSRKIGFRHVNLGVGWGTNIQSVTPTI